MTPPLSLDRLKELARKRKREAGITHTLALEQVAQEAGYPNWKAAHSALTVSTSGPVPGDLRSNKG